MPSIEASLSWVVEKRTRNVEKRDHSSHQTSCQKLTLSPFPTGNKIKLESSHPVIFTHNPFLCVLLTRKVHKSPVPTPYLPPMTFFHKLPLSCHFHRTALLRIVHVLTSELPKSLGQQTVPQSKGWIFLFSSETSLGESHAEICPMCCSNKHVDWTKFLWTTLVYLLLR